MKVGMEIPGKENRSARHGLAQTRKDRHSTDPENMDAAIFRSGDNLIVNFTSIRVAKPTFLTKSRVGHILKKLDFRQVTI